MRVTNNMMIQNMMQNLNRNILRLDKSQMQVATGKRVHAPSDDPVAISRSLKIRADLSELKQFKANVDDSASYLETTELAVDKVGEALQRLRELTVQASNGVLTPEDTKKIKGEVEQIKEQIVSLGNTTYAGKYIFSGKKTDEPLFKFDTGVGDYVYNVDLKNELDPALVDDKIKFEVGVNESIEINSLGFEVFDDVPAKEVNANGPIGIVNMINNIMTDLDAGNSANLSAAIDNVDHYLNINLTVRSEIGAKVNRMELIQNRIEDDTINFTNLQSKLEDADMGKVITQLLNEENVYRASLSVGAKIIQPSLLDFLR
ncbi:flagellar hook-associated protein FlgL [Alkaliphilus hydrothermalis]|uniref:Flagellar hook-associated protein 3 FlgL n=1 Tax=Alkaliphilus hydrothermalis TaxID=1482730 RepID=A0ABS2NS22_9FIRM|nr:flagellar hook-associated protein FlgL [Alkaliphilus hydrothermalis]MBM7615369.1 flagellar hook-associated protein 3 FlgL [Alkaliphilus hydrothermalis]